MIRKENPDAHRHHSQLHGMQTPQLSERQKQKKYSRPSRIEKVLPILQKTHSPSRDEMISHEVTRLEEQKDSGFNLKQFLTEVNSEMKKVSWSTKQELVSYTAVVGIAVVIVCALIWICDTVFARLFTLFLS